jgi:predicted negative regulator of RcsB-dependent stress response
MKNLIVVLLLAALGWYGYGKYQDKLSAQRAVAAELKSPSSKRADQPLAPATASFTCDGRTYCSQMTSCAEATFFLKNCPGTKMDGNNDGIPCEKQWCK